MDACIFVSFWTNISLALLSGASINDIFAIIIVHFSLCLCCHDHICNLNCTVPLHKRHVITFDPSHGHVPCAHFSNTKIFSQGFSHLICNFGANKVNVPLVLCGGFVLFAHAQQIKEEVQINQ